MWYATIITIAIVRATSTSHRRSLTLTEREQGLDEPGRGGHQRVLGRLLHHPAGLAHEQPPAAQSHGLRPVS